MSIVVLEDVVVYVDLFRKNNLVIGLILAILLVDFIEVE